MKLEAGRIRLSPSDLANHLACPHVSSLDRGVLEGRWAKPDHYRPETEILAQRGLEHEKAYLEHLERSGRRLERLPEGEDAAATGPPRGHDRAW